MAFKLLNLLEHENRILITGGAGYIGSSVSNFLIDKGLSVTIIDNLVTGNKKFIPKKHISKNVI